MYRQLKIPELGALGGRCRARVCINWWGVFELLSIIHAVNFDDTCFLAQSFYVLSACHNDLFVYAL